MLADIRERLDTTPFAPFSIRMADGREYPVPTRDHIYRPPGARGRIVVTNDEGVTTLLSALLITGIVETEQPQDAPKV